MNRHNFKIRQNKNTLTFLMRSYYTSFTRARIMYIKKCACAVFAFGSENYDDR